MNTDTGEIATMSEWERLQVAKSKLSLIYASKDVPGQMQKGTPYAEPILMENLSQRVRRMVETTGKGWVSRNSKCPCGSGRRFKRCCMTGRE